MTALAIVILGPAALPLARRLQQLCPGSGLHAPRRRCGAFADEGDQLFEDFGTHLRALHAGTMPVVAVCAAGIIIRALAPRLAEDDKLQGAAILALAPDGSTVVPLLGGLRGANQVAREIADRLACPAAITTSGELRFGTCLLQPPPGYVLADIERGKQVVSDLLAGGTVSVEGHAPWLATVDLPRAASAGHRIRVSATDTAPASDELRFYPRSVAIACRNEAGADAGTLQQHWLQALQQAGLALPSLAVVLIPASSRGQQAIAEAARALHVPLRLLDGHRDEQAAVLLQQVLPAARHWVSGPPLALALAPQPLAVDRIGRERGSVSVIGLGPGHADYMIPAARQALERATDILGYATYVEMAGPLRPGQRRHPSDNREELQRARQAFALAAEGRQVAIVSSGDPGIFAMAAAVLEALETATEPGWHELGLEILPGVSAAMATAAVAGAPLGHDFCLLSLSDHLKPWSLIERRLQLAAEADLALGLYNPISSQRPWQLARALDIIRAHRAPTTPVLLGWNIARPGARLISTRLQDLRSEQVDMRTLVIIGSSTTRGFSRGDGREWVYTPRRYPFPSSP